MRKIKVYFTFVLLSFFLFVAVKNTELMQQGNEEDTISRYIEKHSDLDVQNYLHRLLPKSEKEKMPFENNSELQPYLEKLRTLADGDEKKLAAELFLFFCQAKGEREGIFAVSFPCYLNLNPENIYSALYPYLLEKNNEIRAKSFEFMSYLGLFSYDTLPNINEKQHSERTDFTLGFLPRFLTENKGKELSPEAKKAILSCIGQNPKITLKFLADMYMTEKEAALLKQQLEQNISEQIEQEWSHSSYWWLRDYFGTKLQYELLQKNIADLTNRRISLWKQFWNLQDSDIISVSGLTKVQFFTGDVKISEMQSLPEYKELFLKFLALNKESTLRVNSLSAPRYRKKDIPSNYEVILKIETKNNGLFFVRILIPDQEKNKTGYQIHVPPELQNGFGRPFFTESDNQILKNIITSKIQTKLVKTKSKWMDGSFEKNDIWVNQQLGCNFATISED